MSIVSQTEQAYAVHITSRPMRPVIMCPKDTDEANDRGEVISFNPLDGVQLCEIEQIRGEQVKCSVCEVDLI